MFTFVEGVFADRNAANRAASALRHDGFNGIQIIDVRHNDLAPSPAPAFRLRPDLELLKAPLVGAVVDGIIGLIADWYLGMRLTWPSLGYEHPLLAAIFTLAAGGTYAGTIVMLLLVGRLAAERGEKDAVVTACVALPRIARAKELLHTAGARTVRCGSLTISQAGLFGRSGNRFTRN